MAATDALINYQKRHSSVDGPDGLYVGTELDSISKSINLLNDTVKAVAVLTPTIPLTQIAGIVTGSFLGNFSGVTASPSVYTATQITAQLDALVGATGTVAGTKGLVPAPAATDNTKFLRGDATYQVVITSVAGLLVNTNNLSDLSNAATARTNLGLGTAATQTVGVAANNVVQLNGTSQLPAVDGSLLTGIAQAGRLIAGTPLVLNPYANNGSTTQAHGLGVVPTVLTYVMECLTADLNYSVGDKVNLALSQTLGNVLVDATNIVLIRSTSSFTLLNKTAFGSSLINNASWKLTVTPYKLT